MPSYYSDGAAPPSAFVLMLRVCQGRISPLDGVAKEGWPEPLRHLATRCCSLLPAQRPP